MAYGLDIAATSIGATVGICGVLIGSTLTTRAQRRHWTRDRQIEACTTLISESTHMQLTLLRVWKSGEIVDWTAWNQALALVWLMGDSEVIDAAARMDRIFWLCNSQIKDGQLTEEKSWTPMRSQMESSRLDFINIARTKIVGFRNRIAQVPVSRPSESD
jgi:hypothetical protein